MGNRWVGAGIVALVAGLAVLLALALTDGDEDASSGADAPAFGPTEPDPDAETLAAGANWELVISPDQALQLFRDRKGITGAESVRGYAQPPVLDEAASFLVGPPHRRRTLVAGPVHEDAQRVIVATPSGRRAESQPFDVHGLKWFWVEFSGAAAVATIEATDAGGQAVDEFTLPTMPPPAPPIVHRGTRRELRERAEDNGSVRARRPPSR